MENASFNLQSLSIVYSPIPIDQLIDKIVTKVLEKTNSQPSVITNDIKYELVRIEPLLDAMDKTRPTLLSYVKSGTLRSHYFESGSPIFLREELIEDIKALPGYHEIYRKLHAIK